MGKGHLNAAIKGRVLYYYDTNEKKKYVSVVPEDEDPRDYMRPYYTPTELYATAKERAVRRVRMDANVNAHAKNKRMSELRHTQMQYVNQIEHIPMELIMQHELDPRFKDESLHKLVQETEKLEEVTPVFEEQQMHYALRNKLNFERASVRQKRLAKSKWIAESVK